jgi:hypothetical protein
MADAGLEFPSWRARWWRLRIAIGRRLNKYIVPARQLAFVENRANVMRARSPGARLVPEQIEHLRKYMLDVQDRDIRREYFRATPIERTFQGLILPLVAEVLEGDPSISSVMNVGVSYAHIDGLLARTYPAVRFTCVDFATNLADYNAEFARENLEFRSGYAMEMMESGELRADVMLMSSAAYEIKNAEVRRYFELFAKNGGRYVVLNDPIYPLPGGAIVDPDDVSLDESRPVHSLQGVGVHRHGPLARVHNYRKMLEAAGFEVIHYHVFRPQFTDLRMANVIGRRRAV